MEVVTKGARASMEAEGASGAGGPPARAAAPRGVPLYTQATRVGALNLKMVGLGKPGNKLVVVDYADGGVEAAARALKNRKKHKVEKAVRFRTLAELEPTMALTVVCMAGLPHEDLAAALARGELDINKAALPGTAMKPVEAAARGGHTELVRWMVREGGADVGHSDAVAWAAYANKLELVKELVSDFGGSAAARTAHGETALHLASDTASLETMRWLVDVAGLDPNDTDSDGLTPGQHLSANIYAKNASQCEAFFISRGLMVPPGVAGMGYPADTCDGCGTKVSLTSTKKLSKCGRCACAKYCSTKCQRSVWSAHKGICKEIAKVPPPETEAAGTASTASATEATETPASATSE